MEDNQGKFQDGKKNKKIIYSNMGYNKYMTEHVEPNKYFYVRGGIFKKRSKYCKVEDCFKISSYGIDKIERCLNHRLKDMTNIRRKHILCKIHDISHGKNVKCKSCKKPNKYCNEDNCYTTASFNFKIDDRPIKCKNHKENNMINVKRKYIVNNNSKITYKKGYICENNKKGGSIKNDKKIKKKTSKDNDNKNNDNKNNHDNRNNHDKNNDNKNNDNKNNDNKNNDDKNNDNKNNDNKKSDKCKFENCDREATYRRLKVGNCHLKDTKYEYCSYHRPKNSINKKFPYKSIFNKVNIPLHYFNHTNENILNDYHDYIYKTLKNNKFKFPIKITIYTENLLYDPFNSNMLNEINVEHIENYEKYFNNSIINTNDVYNKIIEFNDYYINRKIDMLNTHYNRNDYNIDNINEFNALDYNIKQKLSDEINFNNKYSRKMYLELCDLISYQIDNVSKTYTILNENDINIVLNQIKRNMEENFQKLPRTSKDKFLCYKKIELNIFKYQALKKYVGSYIELPKSLQRQGLINIKNNDNYCFIWSYIRHINPQDKNPNRIKLSDKELFKEIHEKLKDFQFPLEINKNKIKKIEDILKVNITILTSDENVIYFQCLYLKIYIKMS